MSPVLLFELSDLFSREALAFDMRGNADEADRLWDIADELHTKYQDDFDAPTLRDMKT